MGVRAKSSNSRQCGASLIEYIILLGVIVMLITIGTFSQLSTGVSRSLFQVACAGLNAEMDMSMLKKLGLSGGGSECTHDLNSATGAADRKPMPPGRK